jgi:hypothetical protein
MPAPGNRSCSSLYLQFSIAISATKKSRLNLSQRPIPFVPQHLRTTYSVRTLALVDSFAVGRGSAGLSGHTRMDADEWSLHLDVRWPRRVILRRPGVLRLYSGFAYTAGK